MYVIQNKKYKQFSWTLSNTVVDISNKYHRVSQKGLTDQDWYLPTFRDLNPFTALAHRYLCALSIRMWSLLSILVWKTNMGSGIQGRRVGKYQSSPVTPFDRQILGHPNISLHWHYYHIVLQTTSLSIVCTRIVTDPCISILVTHLLLKVVRSCTLTS